jgi:hypothetical protein
MPRKSVTPVVERNYGTRARIPHVVKGHKLVDHPGIPSGILAKTRGKVTEFTTYRAATRAIMRTIGAIGGSASDFTIARVGE